MGEVSYFIKYKTIFFSIHSVYVCICVCVCVRSVCNAICSFCNGQIQKKNHTVTWLMELFKFLISALIALMEHIITYNN